MGAFTYRDGVAIIQLIPFSVSLVCGFILAWRHGFRRSEGWVILIIFSLLRVLAASFQLATISHSTDAIYGGALICQGIGLSPLTLLNLGLFVRLNKFVNAINHRVFSAISLLAIAGIVLAIYGGTDSAESPDLETNALLKASVLLFTACYLAFVGMFFYIFRQRDAIPVSERKLLVCFACCSPFMVVRFIYGIIGDYSTSLRPEFSVLSGNVTIFLFLAVFPEIIVVVFFVFTGLRLESLPPELRNSIKTRQRSRTGVESGSRDSSHGLASRTREQV